MQPSQNILAALERSKIARGGYARRFDSNLERVSKLLEGDANGVKTVGEVQRAGLDHRVLQRRRAMRQPCLDRPLPAAGRLLPVAQIVGHFSELVRNAAQF